MTKEVDSQIEKFWDRYKFYSAEASKIGRQLAFGEGAIFWFFFSTKYQATLTWGITVGLFFLILFFMLDILQYLFGAYRYETLAKIAENNRMKKTERPESINTPMIFLYYFKFTALLLASVSLSVQLFISH